jgi:hypothetical protein
MPTDRRRRSRRTGAGPRRAVHYDDTRGGSPGELYRNAQADDACACDDDVRCLRHVCLLRGITTSAKKSHMAFAYFSMRYTDRLGRPVASAVQTLASFTTYWDM